MPDQGKQEANTPGPPQEGDDRDARIHEMERANLRLSHLYEIGKLLTRYRDAERTIPEVIAVIAKTLPIRTAVVSLKLATSPRQPRIITWRAEGESEERLRAARAHAQSTYEYLVGTGRLDPEAATERAPTGLTEAAPVGDGYIVLPLVIDRGAIFGALQIEGGAPLGEDGLHFVNAVVNQLSIAVDRQAAITGRQAAVEASEQEQRLLAEVGLVVGASIDESETLAAVARCAVPLFADLCLVDRVETDGSLRPFDLIAADATAQQKLAELLLRLAPRHGGKTPQARVLETGEPLIFPEIVDPIAEAVTDDGGQSEFFRAAGIRSMIVIPLLARGKKLGVLTFAAAASGRRYWTRDLFLAREIARRAALSMDNAALYQQAQHATRARQELLATVSHDLRNPLSTIVMSVSQLLSRLDSEKTGLLGRRLALIERNAERMKRLIDDLLDAASIEGGHLSLAPSRLDLAPLVTDLIEGMQPLTEGKSVRLESELPSDLPAVRADEKRIQQVLGNLLGNAIKFTPTGGVITVRARAADDELTVSVSDTGPGIAAPHLAHLFDRFWQATDTARLGVGLGLFISRAIVESHGGRIWADSRLDEGSTFSFTLPVAHRDADEPAAAPADPDSGTPASP